MTTKRLINIGGAVIAFGLAYGISSGQADRSRGTALGANGGVTIPRPEVARIVSGTEIAMVYIGRKSCGWSNLPWMPDAVRDIRRLIAATADSLGMSFVTIGVGLDRSSTVALEHLRKMGPFDEISAGHSWFNLASQRFIWNAIPGPEGTPQILVLLREIRLPSLSGAGGFEIAHERLLTRKVGTFEIARWLAAGAPIPTNLFRQKKEID